MEIENIKNQIIAQLDASIDEQYQRWDALTPTDSDYMLYSPYPVGYNTTNEQVYLFQNLLVGYNPELSILDIGCGRADMANFIRNFYGSTSIYNGIDHNPVMSDIAKQKYDIDIKTGAFENATLSKADWVVASGVFTQRRCETEDADLQKLFKDIDQLYELANTTVAFNLLSPIGNKHHEGFFYVHPGLIMDMLIEKYRFVTVRHNYSNDVYTVTIFKI